MREREARNKDWTPLERQLGDYLRRRAPEGECLYFEQFEELARKGRRARDYHRLMRHVLSCPECRQAYQQMQAIHQQPHTISVLRRVQVLFRSPQWVLAPALGVLAIVAVAWWFSAGRQVPEEVRLSAAPSAEEAPLPPPPASEAQPLPAPDTPRPMPPATTAPSAAPVPPAPPARPARPPVNPLQRELTLAQRAAPALKTALQEAARAFATLVPAKDTRSGATEQRLPPLRILKPDIERNFMIADLQPVFEWRSEKQATSYQFVLREADSPEPLVAVETQEPRFAFPSGQGLVPGGEYEVAITAHLASGESVTVSRRFGVLSLEQQKLLAWAQRERQKTPLLSAMVFYYHLDRYADALEALELARKRYPQDKQIPHRREAVKQRIEQRLRDYELR